MIPDQDSSIDKWKELKIFIRDRFFKPFHHPEFVLYFLVIIVGLGAIGVWHTIYVENLKEVIDHSNIIENIASFSVAIIATATIELLFTDKLVIKKPLTVISVGIISLAIITFLLVAVPERNSYWYFAAIPFMIFSLIAWWIANADNQGLTQSFFDEQSDQSIEFAQSVRDYDE